MLTISAPIELKVKTAYVRDPEAFYNRIIGNYSLMENRVNKEDLLHITATPPEIYVSEGEGMTSILNRSDRNETNINKVDILNNVMNRIVMSADVDLTYQDRVFITDALYKLGIKDDRRFMEAFYQMTLETRNTNALIDLYLENQGDITELALSVEEMYRTQLQNTSLIAEKDTENYLYNNVMERLKTGAIYQIVTNFNRSTKENEIDAREYSISNQSYMAKHMLLSILRKNAGFSEEEFVYLNANTYEESIENEDIRLGDVKNEITAAVLMDMLQNIYHAGFEKFFYNNDTFYNFEDTFYKAADQTYLRLLNNATTEFIENRNSQNFIEESRELFRTEIELLKKGEEGNLSEEDIQRITEYLRAYDIRDEIRTQRVLSSRQTRKEVKQLITEKESLKKTQTLLIEKLENRKLTSNEVDELTKTITEINRINNLIDREFITQIERQGGIPLNITERERFIESLTEYLENTENKELTSEEIRRLAETVSSIDTENEETYKQIISHLEKEKEKNIVTSERQSFTETTRDHLETTDERQITDEEIEKLTETVNQINVENEKRRQQYVREIQKLREKEISVEPEDGLPKTRKDAILALSQPEKLIERLQERNERRIERQNNIVNELQHIFPDQSMEVYQILNQFRQGDVSLIQNNIVRPAELGELMSDINSASAPVSEPVKEEPRRDSNVEEFIQAIKAARQEEQLSSKRGDRRSPAQTIHRRTETLSQEELNEQLDMMQKNISKQINKTTTSEVVTNNNTINRTEVMTNETRETQLKARDVQMMIENGLKSQMTAISNQVFSKLEKQMKNEKMRRGY